MTSLTKPDNFKNDWYGWITNQCGHVVLGQMLFVGFMAVALFHGEYASRNTVWAGIAIGYAFWEIINRGAKWDSLEDFIFVCGYGAGIPAMLFREVTPGSSMIVGDLINVLPAVGLFAFHATAGVIFRIIGTGKA